MGFFDYVTSFFKSKTNQDSKIYSYGKYLDTSQNLNVYEASVVRACMHTIAEEASKMILKSVKVKAGLVSQNKDEFNALLLGKPNELMILKDMLYWTAYRLELKSNAYWFPEYWIYKYADGREEKRLKAIYPINSKSEDMVYNDKTKKYELIFRIVNGSTYSIPYDEIIHLRKHYGDSYYFGSEARTDLLKKLKIYDQVTDMMPRAINSTMQLRGILTSKSQMGKDSLTTFKEEFEANVKKGEGGFGVLGVDGEYTPVNTNPTIIDEKVLEHLEKTALMNFGVSMKVLTGDATENEWQSLYQKNIEPLKIAIEQASTHVLFTERDRQFGNQIKVYDKLVNHLSMKTKLEIIKLMGPANYISRAEQRELIGYEPDGGPEKVSLNYVSQELVDEYQLKSKTKEKEEANDDESDES